MRNTQVQVIPAKKPKVSSKSVLQTSKRRVAAYAGWQLMQGSVPTAKSSLIHIIHRSNITQIISTAEATGFLRAYLQMRGRPQL